MRPVRAALALVLGLAALGFGAAPALAAPAEGTPVRLAIAAPIVVPDDTTGLIPADVLAQYTSEVGLLTRQLDAVIGRPVAIAIDPMIIASIRVLGSAAPESAVAWLDRLSSASNETFALGYADNDLTLATQAGTQGVIAPTSFEFAVDPTLFAPAADPTAMPSPTPTTAPSPDDLPPLPTTESLLDWPYTLESVAWPRADTVIASDLTAITAAGFETTILSSTNLAADAGASSVVTVGDAQVLVNDASVTAALVAASRALTPDDWQAALGSLSSALGAASRLQSGDQATIFATLDRSVPTSANRIADTLASLAADASVSLVSMSDALAVAPTNGTIVDKPQNPDDLVQVGRLLLAEQGEQRFATVAENPGLITGSRRLALLAITSNAWQGNRAGWQGVVDDFVEQSVDLRDSVQLVKSSSLNFFADSASIPIAVKNTLDQSVTVYINLDPTTALLAVENPSVELVIPPNSQGTGQVPVQAISNGTVQLTVTLHSASGEVIGSPTVTKVNVQAGWETPIVLGLAILVVGVFGFGIVRNILRRRRQAETPSDD